MSLFNILLLLLIILLIFLIKLLLQIATQKFVRYLGLATNKKNILVQRVLKLDIYISTLAN